MGVVKVQQWGGLINEIMNVKSWRITLNGGLVGWKAMFPIKKTFIFAGVLSGRIDQWSPTFLRSDPILNENVISVYTRPHFVFW